MSSSKETSGCADPSLIASTLAELGLSASEENAGVFTGSAWIGSGDLLTSISPASGLALGRVRQGIKRCLS
jgi:hypothetical protein